jgi:hypothetical protein
LIDGIFAQLWGVGSALLFGLEILGETSMDGLSMGCTLQMAISMRKTYDDITWDGPAVSGAPPGMVEALEIMGCLPPFSTGAGFRWPIHRMMTNPLGPGRRAEPWALSVESHGQVMW